MCGAPYTTRFLGDCLRGRRLVPLERAVRMLTDEPARLFGLRDRGRIAQGFHADLVLFDPERVDAGPAALVHDLPGDGPRLDARAVGVVSVRVGGVETVRHDVVTGGAAGEGAAVGAGHGDGGDRWGGGDGGGAAGGREIFLKWGKWGGDAVSVVRRVRREPLVLPVVMRCLPCLTRSTAGAAARIQGRFPGPFSSGCGNSST
ncbi:hypothetical protein GCM10020000_46620 [Streptomyces olivoverticillatus]